MIYLECNMPAFVGYNISNVSDYTWQGRQKLISGKVIIQLIQELTMFLEACDQNNLKDSMQLSLCPAEVIHLQNLNFKAENGNFMHLNTDVISERIMIIDNIRTTYLRFVLIDTNDFMEDHHFSVLKHIETSFDADTDYLTIFFDQVFLDKNDPSHNDNVMKLIFTCLDHFITSISAVTYNIFSEHPIVFDENDVSCGYLCPMIIFHDRMSTLELLFTAEYLVLICYYMRKWFRLHLEEIQNLFKDFPFCQYIGNENMQKILDTILTAIDDNLNVDSGEVEQILNCEYKVAEYLRDFIMDKVYKGE